MYVAARRKVLDVVRREHRRLEKELSSLIERDPPEAPVVRDDQLRLIFTCRHPSLGLDARVALALRTLCGLSTAEVARAMLVSEPTMAKRLVCAKHKIALARIPYQIPDAVELPRRLAGVCAVVHLVYTAGHASGGDHLLRSDLREEAIRLARLVVALLPDDPLPEALLALLLLTDARQPVRLAADGELTPLADQDRSRWDRGVIGEGLVLLARSLDRTGGRAEPYQLQAAIAACHATAPSYRTTDWSEIVRLYGLLAEVHPNPVVHINAAVALAEVDGPQAAMIRLEAVPDPARSYLWHAAVGEMLERTGRAEEASVAFTDAADAAPSEPERRHLLRRSRTSADSAAPVDDADELTETTSGDDHPDGAPGDRQPVSRTRDVAVAPVQDA